jgi:hypothetical protein
MNFLAIFVAAVLNMAIGALWYSPAMFAKAWMKAIGFDKREMDNQMKKGMGSKYGLMFFNSLVLSFVLALFINFIGVHTFIDGFRTGFLAWLGFAATAQLSNSIFSGKPKELYFINTTYQLVAYSFLGGLLAFWR